MLSVPHPAPPRGRFILQAMGAIERFDASVPHPAPPRGRFILQAMGARED